MSSVPTTTAPTPGGGAPAASIVVEEPKIGIKSKKNKSNDTLVSTMFWGGMAGTIAKTSVAPLERVRLLRQTGGSRVPAMQTFYNIAKQEGVLAFWRGNLLNCARIFPARGILFTTNGKYVEALQVIHDNTFGKQPPAAHVPGSHHTEANRMERPFWVEFLAGGLAGMSSLLLTYPLDVARTHIAGQMQSKGVRKIPGSNVQLALNIKVGSLMWDLLRREGIRSWYRGAGPTLLGALPYEGIKFSAYGQIQKQLAKIFVDVPGLTKYEYQDRLALVRLGSGALAGLCGGLVMFPNDTVRRILQMQGGKNNVTGVANERFTSAWDCWKRTYKEHGITRFYRGVAPYMFRIIPSSAIQFSAYESVKPLY